MKLKKLLSIILSVLLLTAAIPVGTFTASADTSGSCGENLTWQYDTWACTLIISGAGDMNNYSYSSYNYSTITTAPWQQLYNSIKTVVINSGVTSIGSYAFYGFKGLTSIIISDSVTSIGSRAFYGCTGLESITIPDSVTSIGYYAFDNTAWYNNQPYGLVYAGRVAYQYKGICPASVTIKDGTISITDFVFSGCTGLESITIPGSVISMGELAFHNCDFLTKVNYTGNVADWCKISFSNYYSNPLYYAHNLYINNELVADLIIPDGVTSIGEYAFQLCDDLTNVTIPDSVTSIGEQAFYGCEELESIVLGKGVTSIGDYAFKGCYFLKDVYYKGSEEQKSAIEIGNSNHRLLNAEWHYNYISDTPDAGHTAHIPGEWVITSRPTLTKTGEKHRYCTVCGVSVEEGTVPIVDSAAPRIELQYDKAAIGGIVNVDIVLKNNPGITSIKLDVDFGNDFTLKSIAYNEAISGGFQDPYTMDNPVTLNWYNGVKDIGGDFTLATLKLKISKTAETGIKKISVTYDPDDVFNIANQNVDFAVIDGEIDLVKHTPGDINDDGVVNNKDLLRMFKYLSNWPVDVNDAALDTNGDGKVNNKDLVRFLQYLSGWNVKIF